MQCELLDFDQSPDMKTGEHADYRFPKLEDPVQGVSLLVIVWPPGMYARWPGAKLEQQINAVGLCYMILLSNRSV